MMLFVMLLCHSMFTRSVQEGRIRPGCIMWPVLAHRQKVAGAPSCWWYIEWLAWSGMSSLGLLVVHLTKSINVAYQPLYASAMQSAEGSRQAQSSTSKSRIFIRVIDRTHVDNLCDLVWGQNLILKLLHKVTRHPVYQTCDKLRPYAHY